LSASLFDNLLQRKTQDILDACTACGRCVEVCPMTPSVDIDGLPASAVAAGVLSLLQGGCNDAAMRWASACSGSGTCIDACPEAVNPRLMLTLARSTFRGRDAQGARRLGVSRFNRMARSIRVLSRLLLPPDLIGKIDSSVWNDSDPTPPDIVFYTGCNLLKTPHIALICLDVMDALDVSYAVAGGPSHCCGIVHFGAGDIATGLRVGGNTQRKLARFGSDVVAWCPACHAQHTEVNRLSGSESSDLAMQSFIVYLADRIEELRPLMTIRIDRRVAVHEHTGVSGVEQAIQTILGAVPGLELVTLDRPQAGLMCVTIEDSPKFKRDMHENILTEASNAGVDTLVGVYHACHRDLCAHERDWPFEVVNIMEIIGSAMGITRQDQFKRLKLMQDVAAVVEDRREAIAYYDMDIDEVWAVVAEELIGEQSFALRQVAVAPV